MTQSVIFVCQFCAFSATQRDYDGDRGGVHLLRHLQEIHATWALNSEYKIVAAECLSACNRRCVIALSAPQKTTLIFGDLPALESAPSILELAEQYHASPNGLIPRSDRPEILQRGILARIPPLPSN